MKEIKARLTFTEEVLGSIMSNTPSCGENIVAYMNETSKKLPTTTFPKMNGIPFFWDYQIKTFFKDACGALRQSDKHGDKESTKITNYKKKIDGLIFIKERIIPINYVGEIGICEKMMGARVNSSGASAILTTAEAVPKGSTTEFTVQCIDDSLISAVKEWLNFGSLKGLGRWHKGKFVWEEIA